MDVGGICQEWGLVNSRGIPEARLAKTSDTIIVDGTGYEPLLETDRFLLENKAGNILQGLTYLIGATGAGKAIVAVNETYSTAISALQDSPEKGDRIHISPIGDFYPAGDECVLVYEATGRIVPEGGNAFNAGCMVVDVEFLFNLDAAVTGRKPVTKKWLTCTGEIRMPSIVCAHLGTPLEEIISLCGCALDEEFAVIVGNPLTGRVETDMDMPVDKTTNGITVLAKDHMLVTQKKAALASVIRRSKSVSRQDTIYTDLCPRSLLGYDICVESILNQVQYGLMNDDDSVLRGVFLCAECGLCDAYGMPGSMPGIIFAAFKNMLAENGYVPVFPEKTVAVNEMRAGRKVPNRRIIDRLELEAFSETLMRRVKTDPAKVEIPLIDGAALQTIVSVGDRVEEDTCIARAQVKEPGADMHASITGKVTLIDSERIVIQR
jgi:Na+-translocating ferredoxin:NAD+ oxidoreductase RnfC subunit